MANQFALTPAKKKRQRQAERQRLVEEEGYDPREAAAQPATVPVAPSGTLSAADPGVRGGIRGGVLDLATKFGATPAHARYFGDIATDVVDVIPGAGESVGVGEVGDALRKGDWRTAALEGGGLALGAVPIVGDIAAKGLKKVGRDALAEVASKGGKRQAITANSLRSMPLDQAITQAKSGEHIIPKTGGGYVGAPYSAQTQADIDMIRQKFDADVAAGAGGADWYPRAQEWIKEVAGPDPARQSELARNLALFSAQADPGGNLGFSVKARNNAIMGMTPTSAEGKEGVVRTGQQWNTYLDAFNKGEDIPLGQKTGVYADHLDPTRVSPTTGTNDIWHARALGYTTPEGKPWESALTPQQHAWMDAETVLAVDRANKGGIGGRSDWTPGEVQASPWVAGKGRGLEQSRGMTPEEGMAEASKTYPDYAPAMTAYGTHEMTPGRQTGHLPGIAEGDQATRDAFADQSGDWWRGPGGRDALYEAQGAYVAPSTGATGVYGDPVQFNPMEAGRPLVGFSGPTGERVVDPASRQMMTGTEGARAYFDAQDMGGWSIPIGGQKASHNNALELSVPGSPGRDDLAGLMATGSEGGMPNLLDYGGGRAAMTNFGGVNGPVGAKQANAMTQALEGRATAKPTHLDSGSVDYEKEWRGGAAEGEAPKQGTDMATRKMLDNLRPEQEAAFDKPEVKQKVLERFDRDAKVALERGDVVREDIQKARQLFAKGGFKLLRENLGKGILPAAAAGLFLPYATGSKGGKEET